MPGQYISEAELNVVKGLLHYLNENVAPIEGVAFEGRLIDTNGESLGEVHWKPGAGYVLAFPRE